VTIELLLASRSFSNESQGQEMYGCLSADGVVICFFPNKSAFDKFAKFFAATPDLLEALKEVLAASATLHAAIAKATQ
jgi:hypothetical protein